MAISSGRWRFKPESMVFLLVNMHKWKQENVYNNLNWTDIVAVAVLVVATTTATAEKSIPSTLRAASAASAASAATTVQIYTIRCVVPVLPELPEVDPEPIEKRRKNPHPPTNQLCYWVFEYPMEEI